MSKLEQMYLLSAYIEKMLRRYSEPSLKRLYWLSRQSQCEDIISKLEAEVFSYA